MGDPAARVVVIEFSDFHCPFCRQHAREALPQIKKAYVETGQVLYVFRNFPLDTHPRADVQTDAEEARRLGMMATPSFLLGHNDGDNRMRPAGRMAGAQPFEAFKAAIDGLLGK